jgi:hypothetical protein
MYQPAPPQAAGTSLPGGVKLRWIPLIGGIALAISAVLPWIASVQGSPSAKGLDVPASFLFDPLKAGRGGIKVGLMVLLAGVVGAALTLLPVTGAIRRLLGALGVAVAGLYIVQLGRVVDRVGGGVSLTDAIGFGVYVAIGGGLLLAAGK